MGQAADRGSDRKPGTGLRVEREHVLRPDVQAHLPSRSWRLPPLGTGDDRVPAFRQAHVQQCIGPQFFYQNHVAGYLPGAVGEVEVFWPHPDNQFLEIGIPATRTPPSVSGTVRRFIAGEPMNPATN